MNNVVTMRDVAAKAGVSITTANNCASPDRSKKYTKTTVEKVKAAIKELNYDPKKALRTSMANARAKKHNGPANSVFASRDAETAAMEQLRRSGYSNNQIAKKCGVSYSTVKNRIGTQPKNMTQANLRLAKRHASAQRQIRLRLAQQNTIAEYNKKVMSFNAELEKLKVAYDQINSLKTEAGKASKACKTPLVQINKLVS